MEKGTANAYLAEVKKNLGMVGGQKIRDWYNKNVSDIGGGLWFWCCAYIVYCAVKAGVPKDVIMHTASSSAMLNFFKSQGRYKSRESGYKPKAADIIFFDYLPNDGKPASHMGIVVKCDGIYVYTIEGNSGNKSDGEVMEHKYLLTCDKIRGYGLPKYKEVKKPEEKILDKKGYKKGDKSLGVLALKQLLLLARKRGIVYATFDNNNSFGNGTEKAVNQVLNHFKYSENGIVGENFIKQLTKEIKK